MHLAFAQRADLNAISQQGPATPIRHTHQAHPLIGRDVAGYGIAYRTYFDAHAPQRPRMMLDPAPR
jgi:rhamnose utilization protein RhaD (predicted bifunctional aldolase and dehydrogenase)